MKKIKFNRIFTYPGWKGYWFFSKDKNGYVECANLLDHPWEPGELCRQLVMDVYSDKSNDEYIAIEAGHSISVRHIDYCKLPGNKVAIRYQAAASKFTNSLCKS